MFTVTKNEMKELERRANDAGLPYLQMMENAGRAAFDVLIARLPDVPRRGPEPAPNVVCSVYYGLRPNAFLLQNVGVRPHVDCVTLLARDHHIARACVGVADALRVGERNTPGDHLIGVEHMLDYDAVRFVVIGEPTHVNLIS